MKALVLGAGGREHALVYALKKSSFVDDVIAAPGNGGISKMVEVFPLNPVNSKEVLELVLTQKVDIVVIGPEAPLVAGVADMLRKEGIKVYGPGRAGAMLEGSKAFAKRFMNDCRIPTAPFDVCSSFDKALKALKKRTPPFVIKADGLAAGKGAFIIDDTTEARNILDQLLVKGVLGKSGHTVVIEDFLAGYEITAMAITDGRTYRMLPLSQDHKRAYDGDKGPNTGGMGAYSPLPQVDDTLKAKIEDEVVKPTVEGLKRKGIDFRGTIYAGLMIHEGSPYVLEYNVRFGDPEAQVVIPICDVDWGRIFVSCAGGNLEESALINATRSGVGVVMASGGYPDKYETGYPIEGLDALEGRDDVIVFHSGTRMERGKFLTNGGRVLTVVGLADDLKEARDKAYRAISSITFKDAHYRRDIAWQAFV
mgnify:FL=1